MVYTNPSLARCPCLVWYSLPGEIHACVVQILDQIRNCVERSDVVTDLLIESARALAVCERWLQLSTLSNVGIGIVRLVDLHHAMQVLFKRPVVPVAFCSGILRITQLQPKRSCVY